MLQNHDKPQRPKPNTSRSKALPFANAHDSKIMKNEEASCLPVWGCSCSDLHGQLNIASGAVMHNLTTFDPRDRAAERRRGRGDKPSTPRRQAKRGTGDPGHWASRAGEI